MCFLGEIWGCLLFSYIEHITLHLTTSLCLLFSCLQQEGTNFPNCGHHQKILGTRKMAWSKFHTEDPQMLGNPMQNSVTTMTPTPGICVLTIYSTFSCTSLPLMIPVSNIWSMKLHVLNIICIHVLNLLSCEALLYFSKWAWHEVEYVTD